MYNVSTANTTGFHTFIRPKRGKGFAGDEEVRRHVERLLLRLDFNGQFSKPRVRRHTQENVGARGEDIVKQGGLA